MNYDERGINWARLVERVLASLINAVIYGAFIVAAKVLGIL